MSRHVGQGFLQDAVHGGLHERRQRLGIEPVDPQIQSDPVQVGEVLNVTGHGRSEPHIVEDARVEPTRDASHRVKSLGDDPSKPLGQLGRLCYRRGLLDRPQPH